MANRDAKDWLESVTLDEDDMASDSSTDIASQQSIKKYVDDSVDGLATETYVDTAEADAISSANGYTDTAVTGLATEAYVDTAEADAVSSANSYTDSEVDGLVGLAGVDSIDCTTLSGTTSYDVDMAKAYVIDDVGATQISINLPEIPSGDSGTRIKLLVSRNAPGIKMIADTGQQIAGAADYTISDPYVMYTFIALSAGAATEQWIVDKS